MTAVGLAPGRIAAAGRPVTSAMVRVPFVVALIAILAVGVGGVLFLNTKIDESGMRAEQAKATAAQMRLQIEALDRSIADLDATPRLAKRARQLGMVPAGDAAMIVIRDDGAKPKLIGKPTKVAAQGEGE